MKNNFSGDMWILDSGASCYYCQSTEGVTDIKEINESIKIGNGDSMKSTKIGDLKYKVIQVNGEKFIITLNDVKYVPSLCLNLFSLNKALKVSNDGVLILRDKIWAECVMNITYLSDIISTKSSLKAHLSRYMVKDQYYTLFLKYLVKLEW
jgi:hypothetical protein